MQLAIQEDMLPGDSTLEKLTAAKSLGLDGVEFWAEGLTERVPEVVGALAQTGLKAAAVNAGGIHLLHPDYDEREKTVVILRQAMANTLDLGAVGVVFMPHRADTPRLPDLHPYKSSIELEAELLVTILRATLCDFAYAIGAELYLAPANRYETHLVRRLDYAAVVFEKNNHHPHLKMAANLFHMMLEEDDIYQSLRRHSQQIGYMHVTDHNLRLPGQGILDFGKVSHILRQGNYEGWLTITAGSPGKNAEAAHDFMHELPQSIAMLRDCLKAST